MRIIAQKSLTAFSERHPETRSSLERWAGEVRLGDWKTTSEVQLAFSKAKVIDAERVRFEIGGGNYRLIAAFKFKNQIAFVKFIGTHAAYDRIDARNVSLF